MNSRQAHKILKKPERFGLAQLAEAEKAHMKYFKRHMRQLRFRVKNGLFVRRWYA